MDVRSERIFAVVSSTVSAGDGIPAEFTQPVPARLQDAVPGPGVSLPGGMLLVEFMRRCMTHITTPSTTLISGGSGGSVAVGYATAGPSGIAGKLQGWPFVISGTANILSGQPASNISTTSNQIRKVLVTIPLSGFVSGMSSLALGGGSLGFVYGSAMVTSASVVTSGGPQTSYFDQVPLPLPSAHEVPVGWLNVPNNFATSALISNTMMQCDYRALQGMNFSAMMVGLAQP